MLKQYWTIKHFRKGELIWEYTAKNTLANQGGEAILEYVYRGNSSYAPTEFYIRLCNDTPVVTDDLTTILNEPSTNGYYAQVIEQSTVGFDAKAIASDGNWSITSKTVTFTAIGGDIGPITYAYLATTGGTYDSITHIFTPDNTGKLWAFLPLSMTRTILVGDAMIYSIIVEEGN